jgi:putative aldouronate transport system substrate-binding protein
MGYMSTDMRNLQLQIATLISDARVKYIMGQIDKDGFVAARDAWLAAGGQEIIDSVNAAYLALNP